MLNSMMHDKKNPTYYDIDLKMARLLTLNL